MKKYLFVGLGGALGAISRFVLKNIDLGLNTNIPLNTLLINIMGSFLIALILTASLEGFKMNEDLKFLCTTGFLGGYTTFSTLCKEATELLNKGRTSPAIIYILTSTILGLLAVYVGIILGSRIMPSFKGNEDELEEVN